MPSVPVSQRQVSPQALPSARRTGAPTREELGAGIGEIAANAGVRLVARQAAIENRLAEEERQRANEIAVLDARRQLDEFSNKTATDALSQEGVNAFELPEQTRAAFDAEASRIASGLTNDEQRVAFERVRVAGRDNLDGVVQRHTASQRAKWDDDTTQAVLENSQAAAVANAQDPRRVGAELATMVDTIRAHGKRNGVSEERTQRRVDAITSDTLTDVITRLVDGGQDKAASAYYAETKTLISGQAQGKIEKALEEGSLRGESQRKADEILAAGGTDGEQLEKVRAIDDPKVRDATRERVEHDQAVRRRAADERHDALLVNAGNILDKTPNVARIPPSDWAQMTVGEKTALRQYAKAKVEGVEPTTNVARYYELVTEAGDNPEAFAKRNLWLDRARLGDTEFKQLAGFQKSIKDGARKVEGLDGIRSNLQIAQGALVKLGLDPNPEDKTGAQAQANARFYEALDKRVIALQDQTGKKATNEDVQQIADDLLTEVVTEKGAGVWGGLFSSAPISDVKKRRFEVDPTQPAAPRAVDQVQVPTADRAIITRMLVERGRQPTEEAIRAYYLAATRQTQGSPSR